MALFQRRLWRHYKRKIEFIVGSYRFQPTPLQTYRDSRGPQPEARMLLASTDSKPESSTDDQGTFAVLLPRTTPAACALPAQSSPAPQATVPFSGGDLRICL